MNTRLTKRALRTCLALALTMMAFAFPMTVPGSSVVGLEAGADLTAVAKADCPPCGPENEYELHYDEQTGLTFQCLYKKPPNGDGWGWYLPGT